MGYFKDAAKGVSWVGALRLSTRLIALLKITILGRILLPEQFGLIGIATLVLALVEIFTETGVNIVLLQKKDDIDDYIDTAWVTSIARGIIIFFVIIIFSLFIPLFFNAPEAGTLLVLVSFVPLIKGFINPSIIKLQKNLQFNKDFWYRFAIFVVDACVAVGIAWITKNPSSLVYGLIAGSFLEVLLSFILIKPRPRLNFERAKVLEIIHKGKWITGAGIFEYIFREGDDVVVGRILGTGPLGLYQMAYKIATLPITEVADVFGKVTFPVFVKISGDQKRLKTAFYKTTLGMVFISIPFGLALFLYAKSIILFLLGPNWVEAAPALQLVAIYAVIRAIINPALTVFLAVKKQYMFTAVTLVCIIGMGISIIPLVNRYGISGAGASTVVGSILALPLVCYYIMKIFKET